MPEMGGIRLIQGLRQRDMDTDVIFYTAYGTIAHVQSVYTGQASPQRIGSSALVVNHHLVSSLIQLNGIMFVSYI